MKSRLPKGYGGNMNDMVKRAQEMQNEMQKAQEELEAMTFTTTVGGGAVEVVVTGKKELQSLTIKPEVVDPEDIEMLQDLIISAVNEGMRQVEERSDEDIQRITGGMSVPGLF
ncbi:DNA-binding protein, YbaB/EbfC family [[Clostridium] methylpentosum DSM 5476]|jgi:nucleoid-associated protein EbfC|uniref:Nucleoid-associated protein CLOSTMETH_02564 n=1 Tax=[Clostridium] methylpentosum DSM 5476 TaxID=537013 RepID=C0EFC2_9FIRM|nr:DNA-binding protein, YbaB/EbfC family [[Clostridium] methylpentosum DSM 5476]MDY3988787.1 YbaB/EbfC family nucleoid-associated protein [Massilioclostridium sp.]